jgi:hypothetical protein
VPAEPQAAPIEIERPADPSFGDFASNIALKLAKPYRRGPMDIAKAIAAHVVTASSDPASPIVSVEVAPPGFLNVRVADGHFAALAARILREPTTWGQVAAQHPEHINVEFVSANPTGPLHIGNARGAFAGDLLCRVLSAAGHKVEREYYFNDFGSQVKNLGASVVAIRDNTEIPEDGYRGDYVYDMAKDVPASVYEEAARTGEDPSWAVAPPAPLYEQIRTADSWDIVPVPRTIPRFFISLQGCSPTVDSLFSIVLYNGPARRLEPHLARLLHPVAEARSARRTRAAVQLIRLNFCARRPVPTSVV